MEKKKEFETIYQELYEKSNEILNQAKNKKNKKIAIVFWVCFLIILIISFIDTQKNFLFIAIAISLIIFIIILGRENKKYKKIFKEIIIKELVKKCNSKLIFDAYTGVSIMDYKASNFDDSFDEFFAEDKISGMLDKNTEFQMSQIVTKEIHKYKDADGNTKTERTETFRGIYGIVKLQKSINAKIYITSNSITKKYSSSRVEMDSAEFEQGFDCLTKDRMTAMKIFTSDLLEKFVNLKKGKLVPLLLKIENDVIYFRIGCGECLEPPKIKAALDKEVIKKYYNTIFLPTEMIEEIIDNIKLL